MAHNHLAIGKLNKLPRERPVPRSKKPAVCSLVVRVVVLGRTIRWQLRPSRNQLATECACTPYHIAVALESGAVLVTIGVHLVILAREIFDIEACTYG